MLNSTTVTLKVTFADLLYLSPKMEAFATFIEVPLLVTKNVTIKLSCPFAAKFCKVHILAPSTFVHADPS